jgi:hypothetical protein
VCSFYSTDSSILAFIDYKATSHFTTRKTPFLSTDGGVCDSISNFLCSHLLFFLKLLQNFKLFIFLSWRDQEIIKDKIYVLIFVKFGDLRLSRNQNMVVTEKAIHVLSYNKVCARRMGIPQN